MKLHHNITRSIVFSAAIVLVALSIGTIRAYADISNPHPTPPANTVTTAMIKNGAITPPLVQTTGSFTMGGITTTNATTTNEFVTGTTTLATTTVINGVTYKWPTSGGTASQVIQTDGSGNLTFASPILDHTSTNVISATTTTITMPAPVYLLHNAGVTPVYDAAGSTGYYGAWGGTQSETHVVGSGTNRGLWIVFMGSSASTGVSATYGAQTATLATSTANGIYVFFLANPTTGSATVTVTATGGGTQDYFVLSTSYSNVAQTQGNIAQTETGQSMTSTTTISSSWVGVAGSTNQGCTPSVGTHITSRATQSPDHWAFVGDNNAPVVPAGALTQTINGSSCAVYTFVTFPIAPITPDFYGTDLASAADAARSASFIGFVKSSLVTAVAQQVITGGYLSGFTGLTPAVPYYISNTIGSISTSAGTVPHKVGVSLSPTELLVTQD